MKQIDRRSFLKGTLLTAAAASIPSYSSAIAYDNDGQEIRKFSGGGNHYENFINAVRSRKASDLNSDILEGHLSSALCHTGNISYRLGKSAAPEEIRDLMLTDREATETFERMLVHLETNEVDLRKTPLTFGPVLRMNTRRERFTNHNDANTLLTREYRAPYVVPRI